MKKSFKGLLMNKSTNKKKNRVFQIGLKKGLRILATSLVEIKAKMRPKRGF